MPTVLQEACQVGESRWLPLWRAGGRAGPGAVGGGAGAEEGSGRDWRGASRQSQSPRRGDVGLGGDVLRHLTAEMVGPKTSLPEPASRWLFLRLTGHVFQAKRAQPGQKRHPCELPGGDGRLNLGQMVRRVVGTPLQYPLASPATGAGPEGTAGRGRPG